MSKKTVLEEDVALHSALLETLNLFPFLLQTKPSSWPSGMKISQVKLREYFEKREGDHVINLPLMIHNATFNKNAEVKALFSAMLAKIDWFCVEFIQKNIPGAGKLVAPVWRENWDFHDSRIFNALAEIYFTDFIQMVGFHVEGFERQYSPDSGKTADILTSHNGNKIYIDVKNPLIANSFSSKEELRNRIISDANAAMEKEFQFLSEDALGMIALIYRPFGEAASFFQVGDHDTLAIVQREGHTNQFAEVYWIKQVFNEKGRDLMLFNHNTKI